MEIGRENQQVRGRGGVMEWGRKEARKETEREGVKGEMKRGCRKWEKEKKYDNGIKRGKNWCKEREDMIKRKGRKTRRPKVEKGRKVIDIGKMKKMTKRRK